MGFRKMADGSISRVTKVVRLQTLWEPCDRYQSKRFSNPAGSCRIAKDDVANRFGKEDPKQIKVHESCRATYTHKERRHSNKHDKTSDRVISHQQSTLLRSKVAPFHWQTQCVVCGKIETSTNLLYSATKHPRDIDRNLQEAARQRQDEGVRLRMTFHVDQCKLRWRYHKQ